MQADKKSESKQRERKSTIKENQTIYMKSFKKYLQKEQGTYSSCYKFNASVNLLQQYISAVSSTTEERSLDNDSTDDSDSKQCCVCYDEVEETPNYHLAGFQTLYLHFHPSRQKSLHQNKSLTLI